MVVACPNSVIITNKKSKVATTRGVPTIDLSCINKEELREGIVEACQEFGIFKVVNHGVGKETISKLEKHGMEFFSRTTPTPEKEKVRVSPGNPFGYGSKNIGVNGDMGELEYLLLHASNTNSNSNSINLPHLSNAAREYVGEVKELACELLDVMGEGLKLSDKSALSNLIRDVQSDCLLRLNHYPSLLKQHSSSTTGPSTAGGGGGGGERIGFGEHSDPQILTILRSNDVGGLQIRMRDGGFWLPVQPDPNAFYVMVGDALQVLSNGRFVSVKHRAMANNSGSKGRMSIMFFGGPPPNAMITPLKETVSSLSPSIYMPFTWGEYKRVMRTSRLGDCRLNLFKRRFES